MASYRGHLTFSTALGAAYGGLAAWEWNLDWGPACLGAGLTALGGMLPDLDSESGVPVRELSGLAAAATPFLLLHRLQYSGFTPDQILVLAGASFLLIRYAVGSLFKLLTVHRGMFHSIPAMLIAGLSVFLLYQNPVTWLRIYVALGVMLGFLSHLILDELCSVNFSGMRVHLKASAGSALKLYSSSWSATLTTYVILAGLVWLASEEMDAAHVGWHDVWAQIRRWW
jgi:hypothetical protein